MCGCRQDEPASCLYVLISGRIRLIREDPGLRPRVRVEEEVGRGEAVGAVWALTGGIHDTTALCVRDSELVRMSKVSTAHNDAGLAITPICLSRSAVQQVCCGLHEVSEVPQSS